MTPRVLIFLCRSVPDAHPKPSRFQNVTALRSTGVWSGGANHACQRGDSISRAKLSANLTCFGKSTVWVLAKSQHDLDYS
jgi:hypothetical protein